MVAFRRMQDFIHAGHYQTAEISILCTDTSHVLEIYSTSLNAYDLLNVIFYIFQRQIQVMMIGEHESHIQVIFKFQMLFHILTT